MEVFAVPSSLMEERMDGNFYRPIYRENTAKIRRLGTIRFGGLYAKSGIGHTASVSPHYDTNGNGIPFVAGKAIEAGRLHIEKTERIRVESHNEAMRKSQLDSGYLLVVRKGDVGNACVVPNSSGHLNCSSEIMFFVIKQRSLAHYLSAFFNSVHGRLATQRLQRGSLISGVSLLDIPELGVLWPYEDVRAYIGDKVRLAERLRQMSRGRSAYALRLVNAFLADEKSATHLEHEVSRLLDGEVLTDTSFQQIESTSARQPDQGRKSSRIPKNLLTTRLDCNFYNRDALELDMRFAKGYEVATFGDIVDHSRPITNGVRGPDIQSSMFKLVRLQDFAGWSIDFDNCLTISEAQFRENRRCQLQEGDVVVAIGGYIGHAAMARRVQTAVIGQHSAVLPMGTNSKVDAGCLVAFLSSNAGAIQLQRYVSGTVQVGINLEDLRQIRLPLPSSVLQKHIGNAVRQADDCSHWASRLLSLACRLVEALIEGRITENELCEAYVALNAGDRQADSSILERMTVGGLDVSHESPLFPDLDGLYAAIDEAERDHTDGKTS